jgi:hypothetical protein
LEQLKRAAARLIKPNAVCVRESLVGW